MFIQLDFKLYTIQVLAKKFGAYLFAACCSIYASNSFSGDTYTHFHSENLSFAKSTYLLDLQQGSFLSQVARGNRYGGFELSSGKFMSFNNWYRSKWTDSSASWMTQINENFGIIYGFSTGERAEKFTINPSLKLGFVMQTKMHADVTFAIRASTIIGGALKEKSCTADYGEIGDIQKVNCRLAATPLAPAETLKFLLNERPFNRNQIFTSITWQF
jgi:hypothetical protein